MRDEATPVVDAKSRARRPARCPRPADIAKGRVGDGKSAAGDVAKGAADDGAAADAVRRGTCAARTRRVRWIGPRGRTRRFGRCEVSPQRIGGPSKRGQKRGRGIGHRLDRVAAPVLVALQLAGQVAGPIMEALGDPAKAPAQSAPASSDAHPSHAGGGGALKTLTIQLHPEHLGTVDVSMRLNEGRLTLELAASRSDTASMLLDDQAFAAQASGARRLLARRRRDLRHHPRQRQLQTADSGATSSHQNEHGGRPAGEGRPDGRAPSGGSDDPSGRRRSAPSTATMPLRPNRRPAPPTSDRREREGRALGSGHPFCLFDRARSCPVPAFGRLQGSR